MAIKKPSHGWDRLRQLSELALCGSGTCVLNDYTGEDAMPCVDRLTIRWDRQTAHGM